VVGFTLRETRFGGSWTLYYEIVGEHFPRADLGAWNLGFELKGEKLCPHITTMKYRHVAPDWEEQLIKFDSAYYDTRLQIKLY
jgi:hypothetical protein